MNRKRVRLPLVVAAASALVIASAAGLAHERAIPAAASPLETLYLDCPAPSLGGKLPVAVHLPPGYANEWVRYPVIYFLHGLPASPDSYKSLEFVAQAIADSHEQAIVVVPQGARQVAADREYLDWDSTEDWPDAIARDLPRCIDFRFRTIANRDGRALIGMSAGGFGAFNIGLRRLATFAAVESWSGYFSATDPSGWHVLQFGSARANEDATIPTAGHVRAELRQWPTFLGFFVGRQDSRFLNWNVALNREFNAEHVPHWFAIYQGGHSEPLWSGRAPLWLGAAIRHLAAAQRY